MQTAPLPVDEEQRLVALRRYRLGEKGHPGEAFARVTGLCARIFAVPIAFVSLVESRRQWFLAARGLSLCESPREHAFCSHVIYRGEPLVVADAGSDPRFADSPLVTGEPYIRFYAGAPLVVEEGLSIGTLCIVDGQPRTLDPGQLQTLCDLAATVVDELELRLSALRLEEERAAVERQSRELRRSNLELQQAKEEAERGNRAKMQFLASMNHELRTPLNAVLGFGQLLEQGDAEPLSARQQSYVQQVLGGGRHLLGLIDKILDYAGIEAGRVTLACEPFEFAAVIRECTDLVAPLADGMGVRPEVILHEGLPERLHGDRERLRQVLYNLLSNAIKYNRPEGWVVVEVRPLSPGWLRLAVRDSGIGIPSTRQRELFYPFSRLGLESSTVEGTGIGLVATRRLVEQLGGEIQFTSEEGIGSTFWVDLPTHMGA
ncbi:MAG: GAF domain-containing sensor histidine kinase [Halorhodospira sp.]